ncbi:MAG: hypothetical protein ACLPVW_03930 [Terriglobales bacterium]
MDTAARITPLTNCYRISGCQLLEEGAPSDAFMVAVKIRLSMPIKPKTIPAAMNEGPQAFEVFRNAARRILSISKSALPPDPFKKARPLRKKKANRH